MINAEEARELHKISLITLKKRILEMIEENIKGAIARGDNKCYVWIKKNITKDIIWNLKYIYGYEAKYYYDPTPLGHENFYVEISW